MISQPVTVGDLCLRDKCYSIAVQQVHAALQARSVIAFSRISSQEKQTNNLQLMTFGTLSPKERQACRSSMGGTRSHTLGWNSLAADWARARRANLGAASRANLGPPLRLAVAPVKMAVPLPASSWAGSSCTAKGSLSIGLALQLHQDFCK